MISCVLIQEEVEKWSSHWVQHWENCCQNREFNLISPNSWKFCIQN